jgi:putative FmdB family regulatory protein
MPTYDYECDACKHAFEKFQSIKAPVLRKCPKCGRQKLRRLIGIGAGVIFKGSGFYQTDYRSSGYRQSAKADKSAAPAAATSTDSGAKADKPAAPKTASTASASPAKGKAAG